MVGVTVAVRVGWEQLENPTARSIKRNTVNIPDFFMVNPMFGPGIKIAYFQTLNNLL